MWEAEAPEPLGKGMMAAHIILGGKGLPEVANRAQEVAQALLRRLEFTVIWIAKTDRIHKEATGTPLTGCLLMLILARGTAPPEVTQVAAVAAAML